MDWILPPLEPQNETSGVPQWWSEPLFCAVSIVKYVIVVEVKFYALVFKYSSILATDLWHYILFLLFDAQEAEFERCRQLQVLIKLVSVYLHMIRWL